VKSTSDQLSIELQADGMEIRGEEWGEIAVKRIAFPAGTDVSPLLEGLPDDLCPCPHWGHVISGEMHVRYGDGSEETIATGEFYYWPPGHTVWTDTGAVFHEFSPAAELRRVMDHVATRMAG
jgi:hypothetical protein